MDTIQYRGKNITDMTREELIEVIKFAVFDIKRHEKNSRERTKRLLKRIA